ncbi:hypothetical protein Rsub_08801, partial [Raphidocelis subcapitata]
MLHAGARSLGATAAGARHSAAAGAQLLSRTPLRGAVHRASALPAAPAPPTRRVRRTAVAAVPSVVPPPAAGTTHESINGRVVSAEALFSSAYLFSLPAVQRPYDWADDNTLQLLEDLLDSLGDDAAQPIADKEQYMLGLITLSESTPGGGAYSRKHIIDGQQRIITLALILAAARERLLTAASGSGGAGGAAPSPDDKSARAYSQMAASLEKRLFQLGDPATDLEDQPRIQLKSQADTGFLTALLTDLEFVRRRGREVHCEGSSQPKLWANMQAVNVRMADMDAAVCMQLAKYILQKVTFIVTLSSSFSLALRVFKT